MANRDENIVINLWLVFATAVLSMIIYGYFFWTVAPVPEEMLKNDRSASDSCGSKLIVAGVDENRLSSFERRLGYEYRFIIFDWANDAARERGFHIALKSNKMRIYVYDFAPRNASLFNFGDRLIDVDGKQYTDITDFETHIKEAYSRKRLCTCIAERPISDQAMRDVTLTMLSEESSFASISSFATTGES